MYTLPTPCFLQFEEECPRGTEFEFFRFSEKNLLDPTLSPPIFRWKKIGDDLGTEDLGTNVHQYCAMDVLCLSYYNSTVAGEVSSSCACRAIVMSMRSRFMCVSASTRLNSLRSTSSLRLQKSCSAHHLPTLCCTLSSKGSTSVPQLQIPLEMCSIETANDKYKK